MINTGKVIKIVTTIPNNKKTINIYDGYISSFKYRTTSNVTSLLKIYIFNADIVFNTKNLELKRIYVAIPATRISNFNNRQLRIKNHVDMFINSKKDDILAISGVSSLTFLNYNHICNIGLDFNNRRALLKSIILSPEISNLINKKVLYQTYQKRFYKQQLTNKIAMMIYIEKMLINCIYDKKFSMALLANIQKIDYEALVNLINYYRMIIIDKQTEYIEKKYDMLSYNTILLNILKTNGLLASLKKRRFINENTLKHVIKDIESISMINNMIITK